MRYVSYSILFVIFLLVLGFMFLNAVEKESKWREERIQDWFQTDDEYNYEMSRFK